MSHSAFYQAIILSPTHSLSNSHIQWQTTTKISSVLLLDHHQDILSNRRRRCITMPVQRASGNSRKVNGNNNNNHMEDMISMVNHKMATMAHRKECNMVNNNQGCRRRVTMLTTERDQAPAKDAVQHFLVPWPAAAV